MHVSLKAMTDTVEMFMPMLEAIGLDLERPANFP